MGRYVFTGRDLEPLRPILEEPVIAQALAAAVMIKQFQARGTRQDEVELPVPVRSRDQPDGVPLDRILEAAKAASSTVQGLAMRGGTAIVIHDGTPTAQQQKRLRQLLGSQEKLNELNEPSPPPPAAGAPEGAGDLKQLLLDQATPDAEWIRAFRRYAVEQLIQSPGRD